jgi:hypothetical protein
MCWAINQPAAKMHIHITVAYLAAHKRTETDRETDILQIPKSSPPDCMHLNILLLRSFKLYRYCKRRS